MTKKTLMILFTALSISVVLTGCKSRKDVQDSLAEKLSETTVEKTDDDSPEKKEEPAVEEETETATDEEGDNEISEDIYKADASKVFSAMADWTYTFSSGAGGWATELNVNPDGSFSGSYHDSDMGSTGPDHENGTIYLCDFSGHFSENVRMAGPLMYALTVEDMKFENEPDTEEILEDVLYKYSKPYGLEDITGEEGALVFMDAGAVTSAIKQEEMDWLSPTHFGGYVGEEWKYIEDKPDTLPYAAIINTKDDYAFFSHNISGKNKTFVANNVKLPGLINTKSNFEEDGTYCYEDTNSYGDFRVINTCFSITGDHDVRNEADKFVGDCLKHIYGKDAPKDDELYVTSPKDAYYMYYDRMILAGEDTDYATWDRKGYDGDIECRGRFMYNRLDENTAYAYAFIIESNGRYPSKTFPDGSFANYWISSLNLTGLSDSLSSAGGKKGAVSVINCDMKLPKEDTVSAREIIMVGMDDTELIKKYHLENADFDDDYEIVIPDRNYREYKLAEGSNTPFYMQYPEDGAHRLYYAYDMDEYMNRSDDSEENTCMMYLYLNEDDEVVYGFEEYTP